MEVMVTRAAATVAELLLYTVCSGEAEMVVTG